MVRLDAALIKKRSEHNEGMISTLEEIALHQQEIEKIEALEECCRHVKIVLLQNNAIGKMENLSKLHELEYLNLALNNIECLEGLDGCEALKKLDMTVNFIYPQNLRASMRALKGCMALEDLYLTGNPCDSDFAECRLYCIAHVPSLKQYNGELVSKKERIAAWQRREELEASLDECARAYMAKQAAGPATDLQHEAYTPQLRLEMNREMAEQKAVKEKNEAERMGVLPKEPRDVPGPYNARGEIRQCNEGKYDFMLDDHSSTEFVHFELALPMHLETQNVDVDVAPLYVRVVVKDKVTQLRLPCEVSLDDCKVQRSRTTGRLVLKMRKLQVDARAAARAAASASVDGGLPEVQLLCGAEEKGKSARKGKLPTGAKVTESAPRQATRTLGAGLGVGAQAAASLLGLRTDERPLREKGNVTMMARRNDGKTCSERGAYDDPQEGAQNAKGRLEYDRVGKGEPDDLPPLEHVPASERRRI